MIFRIKYLDGISMALLLCHFSAFSADLTTEDTILSPIEVIAPPLPKPPNTATLSSSPLFDTPLSASVLSVNNFADRNPKDIADIVDYTAGASRRANYWGVNTPTFQLRGFNAGDATAYYKDGFRYQGRGSMSMANVESVEILRGPLSAMYGWNEPGGTVQVLVKKPSKELKQITLQVDTWDKTTATLDLGGAITNNKAYRLIVSHEQGGSFRDHQESKQTLIAPTLAFELSDDKKLELAYEFLDDKRTTDYGIPAINGKPANVPVSRIYTEKFGEQHSQSARLTGRWQQPAFGGNFSAALSNYSFKYLKYHDAEPYKVSGNQVLRTYEDYPEQYHWLTAYVDWQKTFKTGAVTHHFAARFEAAHEKRALKNGVFDEYPAIDIFNPVYGASYSPTADYNVFNQSWRNQTYGLALQDEIAVDDWRLILGVRQNYIHQNFAITETLPVALSKQHTQSDSAITPRVGIVWKMQPSVNLYGNYSSGKMPVLPQNRSFFGDVFKPVSATQFEAGVKVQPENQAWLASAALFSIERNNLLTPDPNHVGYSMQTGKQKSRGLELEFQGNFAEDWRLTAQTTLLDAYIASDNRYKSGNRLPYSARAGASAWLTHQIYLDNHAQLSLSGGVVFQSNRYADFANTALLPSYTRFDFGANYRIKNWTTTATIENFFDKKYYSSGVENRSAVIYPGAPRTLVVEATYHFD